MDEEDEAEGSIIAGNAEAAIDERDMEEDDEAVGCFTTRAGATGEGTWGEDRVDDRDSEVRPCDPVLGANDDDDDDDDDDDEEEEEET